MTTAYLLDATDMASAFVYPDELRRIVRLGLVRLTPWHILDRDQARKRFRGLLERYHAGYIPFARRQDNDDVACLDPAVPGRVVIVHDFAAEGSERRREYPAVWDWFRAAVEDMITFE